jgi:hypothetical protein
LRRCVERGGGQGGFLQRVACQVLPLMRLGEGAQALDAPADKFRDWQENTNSIFWAARKSCASKWKSGSSKKKEPRLRGQHTRGEETKKNLHPRSSEARPESCCPLDKDLSWKSDYRTCGSPQKHLSDKRCGLNGSMQHLLESHAQGLQPLRTLASVDSSGTPSWLCVIDFTVGHFRSLQVSIVRSIP